MKPSTIGVAVVGLGSLIAAGCRTPTQITLDVSTTVSCGSDAKPNALDGTIIRIGPPGTSLDSARLVTRTDRCDTTTRRIGSLVVVPSGSRSDEIGIEVVAGIGKSPEQCVVDHLTGGCIVARRALRFVPHESLDVPIALVAECIDVTCTPTTTCVRGQCVDATIDIDRCAGDVCGEGALGPASTIDAGVRDGDATDTPAPDVDAGGEDSRETGGAGSWVTMAPSSSVGFSGRGLHTAVWTTKDMLIFGGIGAAGILADGASYDPAGNAWTMLPPSGLGPRSLHTAVWTGSEMLVFGGIGAGDGTKHWADGARYDPGTRKWSAMPGAPIAGRDSVAATWSTTTQELVVWGGNGDTAFLGDGAAYDPKANSWRIIAASPLGPRSSAGAVWNGKEMIVLGGGGTCALPTCDDAAAYDPKTNTWRPLAKPGISGRLAPVAVTAGSDGTLAAFFGGGQPAVGIARDDGAIYDGAFDAWTKILAPPTTALAASARTGSVGFWATGRMYVWGGVTGAGELRADGASYDPITLAWSPMASSSLVRRTDATVVWTGTEAIVYGGQSDLSEGDDGARFRP